MTAEWPEISKKYKSKTDDTDKLIMLANEDITLEHLWR